MRLSALFTLVALLSVAGAGSASASNADNCHLLPVAASSTVLRPTQSVGVLYSENTVSTLAYLERYHSMALDGAKNSRLDSRIRAAFVNSSDPRLAIDRLLGSLQQNFASVTVYNSLDALVQAHPDVTVMLDTYSQLVTQRNAEVQARYDATFYDANLQYIGHASGSAGEQLPAVWVHGKSAEQVAAQIDQQRQLQLDALNRFDGSLHALLVPGEVASN